MNKVVTVGSGQSVFDLALQYYGDVSKGLEIILLNPNFENIESEMSGKSININSDDNVINAYFKGKSITTKYPEIQNGYITTDDGVNITTDDGIFITID